MAVVIQSEDIAVHQPVDDHGLKEDEEARQESAGRLEGQRKIIGSHEQVREQPHTGDTGGDGQELESAHTPRQGAVVHQVPFLGVVQQQPRILVPLYFCGCGLTAM